MEVFNIMEVMKFRKDIDIVTNPQGVYKVKN